MEEKKIQNKNVLFLFLIIIILIGGFLVYNNFNNKEEQKIVVEKSPIEITNNDDGTKTVRNVDEDVEIKINNEWTVPDRYLSDEKILVEKINLNNKNDSEMQDGVYMKVYTFDNPDKLNIKKWAVEKWGYEEDEIVLKNISNKEVFEREDFIMFEDYIKEDSKIIRVSFVEVDKVYTYNCISVGKDYLLLSQKCYELIKQNIK